MIQRIASTFVVVVFLQLTWFASVPLAEVELFVDGPPGSETLTLEFGVNPGPQEGASADWFLVNWADMGGELRIESWEAATNTWSEVGGGFENIPAVFTAPSQTINPAVPIPGIPVPNSGAPSVFAFALDYIPNGKLDLSDPNLAYSLVEFTTTGPGPGEPPEPVLSATDGRGRAVKIINIIQDNGGHKPFIFQVLDNELRARCTDYSFPPPGENGPASMSCGLTPTFVDGSGSLIPFPTLTGQVSNGMFELSGSGVVAGFPNILVTFEGTYNDSAAEQFAKGAVVKAPGDCDPGTNSWMYDLLSGTLTFGANGGLPGGLPLIANANVAVPPTTSPVTGKSAAGSIWLLISADKDAVAACSFSAPSTSCPEINQSDTTTIISRNNNSASIFDQARSYFHFTLPNLPAGAEIDQAYINLYDVENLITPSQDSFPIDVAAASWTADTLTWSNQPNQTSGGSLGIGIGPFIEQFRWRGHGTSIDHFIRQIYAGQADNNGFVLDINSNGSYSRGFYSVDRGAANAPRLYLRVTSSVALDDTNVTMPAPPADVEIPSFVFILGDTLPEETCFATN